MAITYLNNRKNGTPVVTNMAADLSNPNYASMHGATPKLGGGSTPQLRYAQQQQNDANAAYNAQQMALANMKNSQMYAPQLANYANADQIAADQAALGKDMSDANNRLNAKYAAMRLNSNLDENNRYQQAMQGMMGQQADMAKFNAQQYADQKNMAAKMAFDQAQQERGFGNEKDLTQMKINADNAQFAQQLAMKPKPLTPYEEAKQKAQAQSDVELAGKHKDALNSATMIDQSLSRITKSLYPNGEPTKDEQGNFIAPNDKMILGNNPYDRAQMAFYENVGGDNAQAKNLQDVRREFKNLTLAAMGGKLGAGVSDSDVNFMKEMMGVVDQSQNINDIYSAFDQMNKRVADIRSRNLPPVPEGIDSNEWAQFMSQRGAGNGQ